MNISPLLAGSVVVAFLVGCASNIPPGAERGPHNTMAYDVLVDATPPGARIEADGDDLGPTPVHLKIFGDPDGTFHDFGHEWYLVKATPLTTNQYPQIRIFGTGHMFGPEDRIPKRIYFNMNQQQPESAYPPGAAYSDYPYYWYGYPFWYGYYYGGPYFGGHFRGRGGFRGGGFRGGGGRGGGHR